MAKRRSSYLARCWSDRKYATCTPFKFCVLHALSPLSPHIGPRNPFSGHTTNDGTERHLPQRRLSRSKDFPYNRTQDLSYSPPPLSSITKDVFAWHTALPANASTSSLYACPRPVPFPRSFQRHPLHDLRPPPRPISATPHDLGQRTLLPQDSRAAHSQYCPSTH